MSPAATHDVHRGALPFPREASCDEAMGSMFEACLTLQAGAR